MRTCFWYKKSIQSNLDVEEKLVSANIVLYLQISSIKSHDIIACFPKIQFYFQIFSKFNLKWLLSFMNRGKHDKFLLQIIHLYQFSFCNSENTWCFINLTLRCALKKRWQIFLVLCLIRVDILTQVFFSLFQAKL